MRVRKTTQSLTLQATAGSNVVILGMDMAKEDCDGLLGFAVHRTDPSESTAKWMEGLKSFEVTQALFPDRNIRPTNIPSRVFVVGFTAGRQYTYRVQALGGTPEGADRKERNGTERYHRGSRRRHAVFHRAPRGVWPPAHQA
ncbi:MAG: hypothetical protein WKF37_21090 [Bryobacteraceae bacterium]